MCYGVANVIYYLQCQRHFEDLASISHAGHQHDTYINILALLSDKDLMTQLTSQHSKHMGFVWHHEARHGLCTCSD